MTTGDKDGGGVKKIMKFAWRNLWMAPYDSLPDVLCDPTDLIWRKGIPFEAMTGSTASSSDGLLAEVFCGFSSAVRQMPGDLCTAPRIISLSPLSLATDVTDATLGTSGLWLGTRTGAGSTATLTDSFLGRSPWLHVYDMIIWYADQIYGQSSIPRLSYEIFFKGKIPLW